MMFNGGITMDATGKWLTAQVGWQESLYLYSNGANAAEVFNSLEVINMVLARLRMLSVDAQLVALRVSSKERWRDSITRITHSHLGLARGGPLPGPPQGGEIVWELPEFDPEESKTVLLNKIWHALFGDDLIKGSGGH